MQLDNVRNSFENFFIPITIPDDLSKEEENSYHSKIFEYCHINTPNQLFRYRSCNNHNIDAFQKDQFLLTKPTKFNDPYDALLYIDKKSILQDLKSSNSSQSKETINKLLSDPEYKKQEIEKFGEHFIEKIIQNASSYQSYNISDDIIKHQQKYYEHRLDLIVELSLKAIKQASLVACLSETVDSILMWSHYASNHSGFVLSYNFQELYSIDTGIAGMKGSHFVDKKIFPVIYRNERYDATYYASFHFIDDFYRSLGLEFNYPFFDKLFYYKALLYKSIEWEYEKEWRIIKNTNINTEDGKADFSLLENIRPKAIYLGEKISKTDKELLIKIAIEKNIKIYQMIIDPYEKEYKLEYYQYK